MAETITYAGQLTTVTCWCGMRHAIPSEMRRHQERKHADGDSFYVYCPLGHTHAPAGESKAEALERQVLKERERSARIDAEREQAEAAARAHKGHATRLRKRVKAGVCPCCKRTVQQLADHMKSKHPDFKPEAVSDA